MLNYHSSLAFGRERGGCADLEQDIESGIRTAENVLAQVTAFSAGAASVK